MHYSHVLSSEIPSHNFLIAIALVGIVLILAGVYLRYSQTSKTQNTSEGIIEEPVFEPNAVEKQLMALGFSNFNVAEAVEYFKLDQRIPFKIRYYKNCDIALQFKLPNNQLVTIKLDSDNVIFTEQNLDIPEVLFTFDERQLSKPLHTGSYESANALLKGLNWRDIFESADTVEVFLSKSAYDKVY